MAPLFGLETEFGFSGPRSEARTGVSALVAAASAIVPSLPDASGAGVFLASGGRLYADGAHPEFATPEVSDPWALVRFTLAGERIVEQALERVAHGHRSVGSFLFRGNVHYSAKTSWGCHESILSRSGSETLAAGLIPHLVSRVLYTGAGGFDAFSPGISFVLSPRAMFIRTTESHSSTADRAIVHLKNEPCSAGPYRRLHLICGESLSSQRAAWLKAAATVLVVSLLDAGHRPDDFAPLANPVAALRTIASDPTCRARVLLEDGRRVTALTLQRGYLSLAERYAGESFMPEWTERACGQWLAVLDEIESGAASVATTLDWAIKRSLFERVLARHSLDWEQAGEWTAALRDGKKASLDDKRGTTLSCARRDLFACDLRFGQLGLDGLFTALDRANALTHRMNGVGDVDAATEHPPEATRARIRGEAVRRLSADRKRWSCDWTRIWSESQDTYLDLDDPFETEERWRPLHRPRPKQPTSDAASREQRAATSRVEPRTVERPINQPPTPPPAGVRPPCAPAVARAALTPRPVALSPETLAAVTSLGLLLNQGFEVAETHCHLAGLHLAAGDLYRAREHARCAWDSRLGAPRSAVARSLWFLVLFAMVEASDWEVWLWRLKVLMERPGCIDRWAETPALAVLRERVTEDRLAMMEKLCRVLRGAAPAASLAGDAWWEALSS